MFLTVLGFNALLGKLLDMRRDEVDLCDARSEDVRTRGKATRNEGDGRTHIVFAQGLQVSRSRSEPPARDWEVGHHCNKERKL